MNNVLCIGDFSSGKSAFINMLLGVRILPEQLQTTDMPVVKIVTGETAAIYAHEPGQKYGRALPSFEAIPKDWSNFEFLELTVPGHPLLEKGLVLWDTPGINSTNERQREHLEGFLRATETDFQTVLFFISGNISNSHMEFLKKWPELLKRTKIVVNVKQTMAEKECRRIENSVKKEVNLGLGNIPVELLYIGDAYEDFAEDSDKRCAGYTDPQRLVLWDKLTIDFDDLKKKHEDNIIGDVIFDILRERHDGIAIGNDPLNQVLQSQEMSPQSADEENSSILVPQASRLYAHAVDAEEKKSNVFLRLFVIASMVCILLLCWVISLGIQLNESSGTVLNPSSGTSQNNDDASTLSSLNAQLDSLKGDNGKLNAANQELKSRITLVKEHLSPLVLKDITFAEMDDEGNIANKGSTSFSSATLKYLDTVLDLAYIDPDDSSSIELYVKILNPDGSLKRGSSSPVGYSFIIKYPENSDMGWGSASGGSYSAGTYTVEVWYHGICLGTKKVDIN